MIEAIGKLLAAITILVVALIAIAVLLAVGLGAMLGASIAYCLWLPTLYFVAVAKSLNTNLDNIGVLESCWLGRNLRIAKHIDQERSYPHYFFGPVEVDMRFTAASASRSIRSNISAARNFGTGLIGDLSNPFGVSAGIGVVAGLGPGAICGLIAAAAVMIIHIFVAAICIVIAALTGIILRLADKTMRFAWGIRLTCPICANSVRPYATYKCDSCGELHRDIRPGRRGIAGRRCICGNRMPTLLLVGVGRLAAMCSECGSALPPRFGKIPIIVIPFFGSVRAGKTQLIYILALAFCSLVEGAGGTAKFTADTSHEIERIGEQLAGNGSPRPTVAKTPEAYVLYIKLGLSERYVYFFDPAGELHYRSDSLDDLRYLDKANTLIFAADPLSVETVWMKLDPEQKERLLAIRSDWAEVELAYELPREQMRRMGNKGRVMRLGFVVTKKDLLAEAGFSEPADESIKDFVTGVDGMDMGNLVREAEQSFGHVGFFETASILDEAGDPDSSVEELAIWLMRSEGITVGGAGQ